MARDDLQSQYQAGFARAQLGDVAIAAELASLQFGALPPLPGKGRVSPDCQDFVVAMISPSAWFTARTDVSNGLLSIGAEGRLCSIPC